MSVYLGMDVEGNVTEAVDIKKQVQPAGVELTVKLVREFLGPGSLGFGNDLRHLPDTEVLEYDVDGGVYLPAGTYLLDLNELVEIPHNKIAMAIPRSSLLRMGATLGTALWDPGYIGHGQVLLIVHNPDGLVLYRNARILQLVYMSLNRVTEETYNGIYQGK